MGSDTSFTVQGRPSRPAFTLVGLLAVITIIGILIALLASAAQAAPVLPSGLDGLGVTTFRQSMLPSDFPMIAQAGLKIVRTDLSWSTVETVKGTYDFSSDAGYYGGMTLDDYYTLCKSNGLTPYFILDYGNSLYGGNGFNTGVDTQQLRDGYTNFAAAAVAHFKAMGGGAIWQIWQEPNLSQYFNGTATDYMNLVREAAPLMRQADSSATILGPSTSGTTSSSQTFIRTCLQQGLLQYVDAVDVHGYHSDGSGAQYSMTAPEAPCSASPHTTTMTDYATIRNMTKTYNSGNAAPLTCSEWGYGVWSGAGGITEEVKADYLARVFLLNLSQGIPLSTWYDWESSDDASVGGHYGLVPEGSRVPNPAYYAAHLLTSSLKGETFSAKLSDGNSADWLLVFTGGGHTTLAAWTTGTSDSAIVPGWGTYQLTSTPFYVNPTLLPGDANLDGKVDVLDLAILAANYRKHVTGGWMQGDFNNDGVVDVEDLALLAANYRQSYASDVVPAYDGLDAAAIKLLSLDGVTVVPESGTLVMLAVALIGELAYTWGKRKQEKTPLSLWERGQRFRI